MKLKLLWLLKSLMTALVHVSRVQVFNSVGKGHIVLVEEDLLVRSLLIGGRKQWLCNDIMSSSQKIN